MSIFSKVEVQQLGDTINHFSATVNGKEVENVKAIDISVGVDETPRARITLNALSEFSGDAETEFWLEPENIRECIKAICFELMMNEDLTRSLVSLIASPLDGDMGKAREIVETIAEEWEW